jgi:glycyl-tRNA synthetase
MDKVSLEDIVSLAKRRGFIFQGSEIYGGLAGTWDYGPLGTLLKRNIVNEWLKYFVDGWDDMYQIDSAILMNPKVWQASGHVDTFTDPLEDGSRFNTMFKTAAGVGDDTTTTYLRPETAQGMFTNYKNVLDSFSPDLPFGIAQVGKAFRNEISPRDFLFRAREFEIMEFEFFINPNDWEKYFEKWRGDMQAWFKHLGLPADKVHEIEVPEDDRAHYSKRTIDFEFDYPFGRSEIGGLAYRTDFDLRNHQEKSGKNLEYRPKDGSEPFVPHVIEPTFGVDRNFLAVLAQAYCEDEQGGEKRVFLKLPAHLAPVKVAVCPLAKNKPELVAKAQEIYKQLKKDIGNVMWIDTGNIGKNYRRADEIGVPYFITVDFQTLDDDTVTIRNRDSAGQKRVKSKDLSF